MRDQHTPDLFDVAWAAGLFEGEGSWHGRRGHVQASLAMCDFDIVERFHAIVGVGSCTHKAARAPWKPQLHWRVSDRAGVEHVFALLRPWLGPRRIARAEELLKQSAAHSAALKARRDGFCKNGHPRTDANTQHLIHSETGRPYRRCRTCDNANNRRYRAERHQVEQTAVTLRQTILP